MITLHLPTRLTAGHGFVVYLGVVTTVRDWYTSTMSYLYRGRVSFSGLFGKFSMHLELARQVYHASMCSDVIMCYIM